MGYRGKVKEREQARALRARNRTLADIARTLGVSKSSVSLWVRDVPFTPTLRLRGAHRRPHPAHQAKLRQIEELNRAGKTRKGRLSDEAFLVAGIALYAGEGAKADGLVKSRTAIRRWCASSVLGSGASSVSTNHVCEPPCTCTRGSTSTPSKRS